MDLSVIIPNYNGVVLLENNLPKVINALLCYLEKNKVRIEIIIIDDASSDKSVDVIKSYVSKVMSKNIEFKILENKKNLGFSPSINKGAKLAKGKILILLNTDVCPDRNFLEPLLPHFRDENVFAVGCMDKSIENGKIVLRGRGVGYFKKGFLVHRRGEVDKTNTLWVSGGSGAFRKSIWDRLGGFCELYTPFYWEDIDLSYRALKSGYKILFEPRSTVTHEHEKGIIKNRYPNFVIKTISYRNQFIFMWSNVTDVDLKFKHLLWLPYHFLKALLKGDMAFYLGFSKAFVLFPKIIKMGNRYKKMFIKSDMETI